MTNDGSYKWAMAAAEGAVAAGENPAENERIAQSNPVGWPGARALPR